MHRHKQGHIAAIIDAHLSGWHGAHSEAQSKQGLNDTGSTLSVTVLPPGCQTTIRNSFHFQVKRKVLFLKGAKN